MEDVRHKSVINYKNLEEDSFLDVTLSNNLMGKGVQTISPAAANASSNDTRSIGLFARTELGGKRLVNNISELQHSRAAEEHLVENSILRA